MKHRFLIHKRGDHVGVAPADIAAGERVVGIYMDDDATSRSEALDPVPLGHKIAVAIGRRRRRGDRVRHRDRHRDGRLRGRRARAHAQPAERTVVTVEGFRRENGRVGVRNHVIILPVDDISNAACEKVAAHGPGHAAAAARLRPAAVRRGSGLHFRTMIGTGCQPERRGRRSSSASSRAGRSGSSTASPGPASRSPASRSRATAISRPCRRASHAAQRCVQHASELRREPSASSSELYISRQVRRIRHDHRPRAPARPSATSSTSSSTPARRCSSARPPS